jgi:hypothetical protein
MKRFIGCFVCLVASLLTTSSAYTEDRFELKFGVGSLSLTSLDLPSSLRKTQVHTDDAGWGGDSQVTNPGELESISFFDLGASVKPLSWKYIDGLGLGYTFRIRISSYEPGYEEGITDRKLYTNTNSCPTCESYTYTKVSNFDVFAHEIFVDYGWTFFEDQSDLSFQLAIGCKYLFGWGMDVEQGWDRYSKEEVWQKTHGYIHGYMPFISFGPIFEFESSILRSVSIMIDLSYADLDIDFGDKGDGEMRGIDWKFTFSGYF